MTSPTTRSFTLGHAMVLVAATAVGLGFSRVIHEAPFRRLEDYLTDHKSPIHILFTVWLPILCAWTIGLFALGTSRSRPWSRGWLRAPGRAAMGAASFAIGVGGLAITPFVVLALDEYGYQDTASHIVGAYTVLFVPIVLGLPGMAVLASWFTLATTVGWRAERSWHDRAGRVIGFAWIAVLLIWPWLLLRN